MRVAVIQGVVLVISVSAQADTLYGLSSSNPSSLYTIDQTTGVATPMVTIGPGRFAGNGFSSLGGVLYGTDAFGGPIPGFSLTTIDPVTGAQGFVL